MDAFAELTARYQTTEGLYAEIESLITDRSIHGRGSTPEAAHCRNVLNPQIAAIRHELNRRGLPSRKPDWIADAEAEAADIRDLADTRGCVL